MMLPPMPRDPSEEYCPHKDGYLSYLDAIEAIRLRKIASGEIKVEPSEAGPLWRAV